MTQSFKDMFAEVLKDIHYNLINNELNTNPEPLKKYFKKFGLEFKHFTPSRNEGEYWQGVYEFLYYNLTFVFKMNDEVKTLINTLAPEFSIWHDDENYFIEIFDIENFDSFDGLEKRLNDIVSDMNDVEVQTQ